MAVWYTLHFRNDLSYFWVHAFHKVPKFPRLICTGIEFHGLWLVDDKAGVLYSNLRHTLNKDLTVITPGFPGGTSGKDPACQCRRHKRCGFDPWVGKIPWRRAWQHTPVFFFYPLQDSCLENPMDRGAWQATVHRAANSRTWLKRLM